MLRVSISMSRSLDRGSKMSIERGRVSSLGCARSDLDRMGILEFGSQKMEVENDEVSRAEIYVGEARTVCVR